MLLVSGATRGTDGTWNLLSDIMGSSSSIAAASECATVSGFLATRALMCVGEGGSEGWRAAVRLVPLRLRIVWF